MITSPIKKSFFTLIELLVVIFIIGLLIAIILPAMRGTNDKAKKTKLNSKIAQIALAAESYYNENDAYPTLAVLKARYSSSNFKTPWGDPITYTFSNTNETFTIKAKCGQGTGFSDIEYTEKGRTP